MQLCEKLLSNTIELVIQSYRVGQIQWTMSSRIRLLLTISRSAEVNKLLSNHKFQELRQYMFNQTFTREETSQILKHCPKVSHFGTSKVALRLGMKAKHHFGPGPGDTFRTDFLKALTNNRDLNVLRDLKQFWTQVSYESLLTPYSYALYYSVFIHTYINLNQPVMALELYINAFNQLCERFPNIVACHSLPTVRLLRLLVEFKDCGGINNILNLIQEEESIKEPKKSIITKSEWFIYLSLACSSNHYELVKTIYDNYLMKGFDQSQLTEDVLFNRELVDLFKEKEITSLIVMLILQTLSTHGDTARSLALIESFYIHRVLEGEKAFTKDIFSMVVEAYCSAENDEIQHLDPELLKYYRDSSMERVLDVIGNYIIKSSDRLSYKDVCQYLSYKFMNYKAYDEHIERDLAKQEATERETEPEKTSNRNMAVSPFGNILANLRILSSFVESHIKYIQTQNYPPETTTLFINCVLNHLSIHQNFSSVASILTVLHQNNANFIKDWLDHDLIDIILNSMANSAAKLSSLHLFNYLRKTTQLTHHHYRCFVSSCLRGDFYSQLTGYLYYYIKDYGFIGSRTLELIDSLPEAIKEDIYHHPQLSQLIHHQDVSNIIPNPQVTDKQLENFNRDYDPVIDQRDYAYIRYLFQDQD